eukprot:TRINITY_DN128_c1_g2_i1.p1 TRINITY_DN128_c1_g2~~TRINITY_DN128_c1_g2_i1.p1  ORF type:complete len:285 (-),score=85.70 TRINITY_DN128_c1_g2_i1:126-980(-)
MFLKLLAFLLPPLLYLNCASAATTSVNFCSTSWVSLQIVTNPEDTLVPFFFRHCNYVGLLVSDPGNLLIFDRDTTWKIMSPGRTGLPGTVSFESENYPNYFLSAGNTTENGTTLTVGTAVTLPQSTFYYEPGDQPLVLGSVFRLRSAMNGRYLGFSRFATPQCSSQGAYLDANDTNAVWAGRHTWILRQANRCSTFRTSSTGTTSTGTTSTGTTSTGTTSTGTTSTGTTAEPVTTRSLTTARTTALRTTSTGTTSTGTTSTGTTSTGTTRNPTTSTGTTSTGTT